MFWSAGCFLLKAEGFLCSLDLLCGGLGIGKLQFFYQKNIKLFVNRKFFSIFGHQNTGFRAIRSRKLSKGGGLGPVLDLEHVKNCCCPPTKFPDIGVGCPHYQDKSQMCYCCSQTVLPRIQVVKDFFIYWIHAYMDTWKLSLHGPVRTARRLGGFIKDEYCSWVQYKSGPGGGPSM